MYKIGDLVAHKTYGPGQVDREVEEVESRPGKYVHVIFEHVSATLPETTLEKHVGILPTPTQKLTRGKKAWATRRKNRKE